MTGSGVFPIADPFSGHALLVSNDAATLAKVAVALRRFAFSLEVHSDPKAAQHVISTRKFHVFVLDMDADDEMSKALDVIHHSPSNQNSVTFVITDSSAHTDFKVRPHFLMQKPLTESLIGSTVKASMGLIVRDYRRYFRYSPNAFVPAFVEDIGGQRQVCQLTNISEGGIAIKTASPLKTGLVMKAEFTLPESMGAFQVVVEVCWSDNIGRAGLRFRSLSRQQAETLQAWLSVKIEQGFPETLKRALQME